jgi:hypothetical protein
MLTGAETCILPCCAMVRCAALCGYVPRLTWLGLAKCLLWGEGHILVQKGYLYDVFLLGFLEHVLRLDLEVTLFGEAIRFSSEMFTKV